MVPVIFFSLQIPSNTKKSIALLQMKELTWRADFGDKYIKLLQFYLKKRVLSKTDKISDKDFALI